MRGNTILNATKPAKPSLRNSVLATPREPEPLHGCNCDRWGHPCPGCVEVQSPAEGDGVLQVHLPKNVVAKPNAIEAKVQ